MDSIWEGVGQLVIEVLLFASLRHYRPTDSGTGTITVDVPDCISLGELLEEMEIDAAEVKTIMVNGEDSTKDRILTDGDRVELFPPDFAGQIVKRAHSDERGIQWN